LWGLERFWGDGEIRRHWGVLLRWIEGVMRDGRGAGSLLLSVCKRGRHAVLYTHVEFDAFGYGVVGMYGMIASGFFGTVNRDLGI